MKDFPQILFWVGLLFISGIAAASFFPFAIWINLIILVLGGVVSIGLKKWSIIIMCLAFLIGLWRFNTALPSNTPANVNYYNGQSLEFSAVIIKVEEKIDKKRATVAVQNMVSGQAVKGLVLVTLPLSTELAEGDIFKFKCRLQAPEKFEDFDYPAYLAKDGIYSLCYEPQHKFIGQAESNLLMKLVRFTKNKTLKIINLTLPEPESALLKGLLVGERSSFPPALTNVFNRTGTTHIVAISGYNISIIATLLFNLCYAVGINRKRALLFIAGGLLFFVILTGASASVVRAAIMGLIVIIAKHFGRQNFAARTIAFAAAFMLFFNPKLLLSDAGFQLSFLATIGLIYFSPFLKNSLVFLPEKFSLRENAASTFAAIIITQPLILYSFGRISLVAPLANLLVLPAIPLAMAVGFLQTIAGLIWLPLGQLAGIITYWNLFYVIKILQIISGCSFASITLKIPAFLMFSIYGIMIIVFIWIRKTVAKNTI